MSPKAVASLQDSRRPARHGLTHAPLPESGFDAAGPSALSHPAPGSIMALQRSAGNRAVAGLLGRTGPAVRAESSVARVTVSGGEVIQRKGKNRKRRGQRKANTRQLRHEKVQELKDDESVTKTQGWGEWAMDWGSWAVEKAANIGGGAMTKAFGVDPIEIGKTLIVVSKSNMSAQNKLLYLALYGTYQATEYLKNNLDSIVGGEAGEMLKMQGDIDDQLEMAARIWNQGGVTEDDVEDAVKDRIVEYLTGE
jgi:hypothetical protein